MRNDKKLYFKIINILSKKPMTRKALIDEYIRSLPLTREELADKRTDSKANIERSKIGPVIDDCLRRGIILKSPDGVYIASDQEPVLIRNERCEGEIIKMLGKHPMTKGEIRLELTKIFGTDKTVTEKDDSKLFAYMGEALKRMTDDEVIVKNGAKYALADKIAAKIDDINSILNLKHAFLVRLHRKGGEFFETYFMTLLEKYVTLFGKVVVTNNTTGGSADGGIDGIMDTVDCLGFRERVMVQTKNRIDSTNETTVRGFYGAVCAKQGTRGIFVTSSDFHPAATAFLDSIDNCIGIDGDKLFDMAVMTRYGIKKCGSELSVDDRII